MFKVAVYILSDKPGSDVIVMMLARPPVAGDYITYATKEFYVEHVLLCDVTLHPHAAEAVVRKIDKEARKRMMSELLMVKRCNLHFGTQQCTLHFNHHGSCIPGSR